VPHDVALGPLPVSWSLILILVLPASMDEEIAGIAIFPVTVPDVNGPVEVNTISPGSLKTPL